jgi:2,3-bisphosphoglycerate-dependent phosphoglycerate mutase
MTTFYFVRHGETEFNVARRVQGHSDSPLTVLGQRQAELVGQRLAYEKCQTIVTSDLGRAISTAAAISKACNLQPVVTPAFREISFGKFECQPWDDCVQFDPALAGRWRSYDVDAKFPGGESRAETFERVQSAIMALVGKPDPIAIITHGGVIQILFRWVLGLPLKTQLSWLPSNASVSKATYEQGEWKSRSWGDTGHLSALGT